MGDLGSIPGLGRSPGQGRGYPLQYSGLENSIDYIVHGVARNQTDWATFTTTTTKPELKVGARIQICIFRIQISAFTHSVIIPFKKESKPLQQKGWKLHWPLLHGHPLLSKATSVICIILRGCSPRHKTCLWRYPKAYLIPTFSFFRFLYKNLNSRWIKIRAWGRMNTCVVRSLLCSPDSSTALFPGYTPIQNKKFTI